MFLSRWRVPEDTIVEEGVRVLHLIPRPCRVPVHSVSIRALDGYLVLGVMRYPRRPICIGLDDAIERAELILAYAILLPVPAIEVTKDGDALCARRPLLVYHISIWHNVKPVFVVGAADVEQAALAVLEDLQPS